MQSNNPLSSKNQEPNSSQSKKENEERVNIKI
jgi:hypothetical protein